MEEHDESTATPPAVLPLAEASALVGVSTQALRKRIQRGTLDGCTVVRDGATVAAVELATLRAAYPQAFGIEPDPATRTTRNRATVDATPADYVLPDGSAYAVKLARVEAERDGLRERVDDLRGQLTLASTRETKLLAQLQAGGGEDEISAVRAQIAEAERNSHEATLGAYKIAVERFSQLLPWFVGVAAALFVALSTLHWREVTEQRDTASAATERADSAHAQLIEARTEVLTATARALDAEHDAAVAEEQARQRALEAAQERAERVRLLGGLAARSVGERAARATLRAWALR